MARTTPEILKSIHVGYTQTNTLLMCSEFHLKRGKLSSEFAIQIGAGTESCISLIFYFFKNYFPMFYLQFYKRFLRLVITQLCNHYM